MHGVVLSNVNVNMKASWLLNKESFITGVWGLVGDLIHYTYCEPKCNTAASPLEFNTGVWSIAIERVIKIPELTTYD